jgi:hypothetical protein
MRPRASVTIIMCIASSAIVTSVSRSSGSTPVSGWPARTCVTSACS